jgi:hypothetical protein
LPADNPIFKIFTAETVFEALPTELTTQSDRIITSATVERKQFIDKAQSPLFAIWQNRRLR